MLWSKWHSVKFIPCDSGYIDFWAQAHLSVFPRSFLCERVSSIVHWALNVRMRPCQQQNLVHFAFVFSADFSLCWLWEYGNLTTNLWCGNMFRIITVFIFISKTLVTVYYDISTAKNLLLLANSTEEQQKWVSRLVKKIPKKPPAPDPFARSSPRTSMKVQPNQSIRRPSRQLPPNKPRWHKSCYLV